MTPVLWRAGVAAAQWLAVRLQLLAAVLVAAVALLAVLGRAGLLPWTPAHSDRCGHVKGQRPCWAYPNKCIGGSTLCSLSAMLGCASAPAATRVPCVMCHVHNLQLALQNCQVHGNGDKVRRSCIYRIGSNVVPFTRNACSL